MVLCRRIRKIKNESTSSNLGGSFFTFFGKIVLLEKNQNKNTKSPKYVKMAQNK